MKISSHSSYTDGHESTIEYTIDDARVPAFVPGPTDHSGASVWGIDADDWWEFMCQYMGDGHGQDSSLGWFYSITILESADPELVGLYWENAGN